uniref:Bm10955 n=1 Tax=Brugia malayi TaxID=6279 RepID=A0A0J9Y376_BRUMA|nr:Bm10955 [Brugia malayi]
MPEAPFTWVSPVCSTYHHGIIHVPCVDPCAACRFIDCKCTCLRTYATNTKRDEDQKSPNTGIYRVAVWLAGCQHIGQRLSSLPSWFS